MRRNVMIALLFVVLQAGIPTSTSWSMGLFKKSSSGQGHSSGNSSGGGEGLSGAYPQSVAGHPTPPVPGGLETNVLPSGDPTDHDALLAEVPHFSPPPHWRETEEKLRFEHAVSSPVPSADQPYAIPEPMTISLVGMGLAGLLLKRRLC